MWWSAPSRFLPTTTRRLTGGYPVGVWWCEEDGYGPLRATTTATARAARPVSPASRAAR